MKLKKAMEWILAQNRRVGFGMPTNAYCRSVDYILDYWNGMPETTRLLCSSPKAGFAAGLEKKRDEGKCLNEHQQSNSI